MTIFTIIGVSVCVVVGTLFAGAFIAFIIAPPYHDKPIFYACMFFGSWLISTIFLILLLIGQLLGK